MMCYTDLDLSALLADVRHHAIVIADNAWPELGALVDDALPDPLKPFALLPLSTGIACGAEAEKLTPLAAAVVLTAQALRIVDDCADGDRAGALYLRTGIGRAVNAVAALTAAATHALLHSPLAPTRAGPLLEEYLQAFLLVCRGQDDDITGVAQTLAEYCAVVQSKTVAAYAFAAWAGARAASNDVTAHERCRTCGTHLGWMIQMLDDVEAFWFPGVSGNPEREFRTFPIFYGLESDHPDAPMLRQLCSTEVVDAPRVRALLDHMGVRRRLVSHALDHRDAALAALDPPFQPGGRAVLQLWMDWSFRDGERLLRE